MNLVYKLYNILRNNYHYACNILRQVIYQLHYIHKNAIAIIHFCAKHYKLFIWQLTINKSYYFYTITQFLLVYIKERYPKNLRRPKTNQYIMMKSYSSTNHIILKHFATN